MANDLQPQISVTLVKKYKRGMITLADMQGKLVAAQTALTSAQTSSDTAVRAKLPLYESMVANYTAAVVKCMSLAMRH